MRKQRILERILESKRRKYFIQALSGQLCRILLGGQEKEHRYLNIVFGKTKVVNTPANRDFIEIAGNDIL